MTAQCRVREVGKQVPAGTADSLSVRLIFNEVETEFLERARLEPGSPTSPVLFVGVACAFCLTRALASGRLRSRAVTVLLIPGFSP